MLTPNGWACNPWVSPDRLRGFDRWTTAARWHRASTATLPSRSLMRWLI